MGDMGDMCKEVKEGDKECHTCEREQTEGGRKVENRTRMILYLH